MKASDKIIKQICKAVPEATPDLVRSILTAAGEAQIFFAEGEGQKTVAGKAVYPDYLQVQISSSYTAGSLAQQLVNVCADALSNGGQLRAPVTLLIAGQAEISE